MTRPRASSPATAFRAIGRRLAVQLFGLSILCWWMIGLGFSGLWWLNNPHQLAWILFCYAWEVPAIGWTGVVLVPWLRWRSIGRLLEAEDERSVLRLSRYPRFVALSAVITSTVGYALGAVQLVVCASSPTLEAWKIAVQGPVLGAVLSAAMYLTAERATRAVRLSSTLRLVAARDAAIVQDSVARKIRYITITIALGAATPIFLFGITREQRRLEQLRAMALEHAIAERLATTAPRAGTVEALPRLGAHTALYALSAVPAPESAGVAVPFFRARRATVITVGDVQLDAARALFDAQDGWFASRFGGHRVVAFRRAPPLLLVAISPLPDFAGELARASAAAAAVLMVALAVAFLLSVTFARSLVDPLRRLRGAALAMTEGRRDVTALASVTPIGGDEVVALTYQFDAMAARVRDEEARLRAAYDELAVAQHQLVQSEKLSAVGRVVSGIAHELNNPLAAVLLFAENLVESGGHTTTDAEMLRMLATQAHRARAIVGDLLSFVREREHRQDAANIGDIVGHAAHAVGPTVDDVGGRLTLLLCDTVPLVRIDALGIEQVLTNLIANGAQAAGPGGSVTVTLMPTDAGIRILIEDTGPGIPDEAMPRIFEPFFTTKGIGKGTGLGLSVSLGIVQQHHGTLTAGNIPEAHGGGARFTLDLPAHPDQAVAIAELRARASQPAPARGNGARRPPTVASRPRIMVIDDEQPIRTALRQYLERGGWAVEEASSGSAALGRLLSAPPGYYRAVITDLMMPDGTGIEVYDRLAAARPDLLARLIIATGDTSSDAVASFRARSARPFLDKPFAFSELEALLAHVE